MPSLKVPVQKAKEAVSILVRDQAFVDSSPHAHCFVSSVKSVKLNRIRRVVVIANALQLDEIADFAHEANHLKRLVLLVRQEENQNWITQLLARSDLRMLRNLLVHSGVAVPKRVMAAWQCGAEERLIADAAVIGDKLFVVDCALNRFEIEFEKIKALAKIPIEDRQNYTISEEGGHISWEEHDVDVDLESLRVILDPTWAEKSKTRKIVHDRAFGSALAKVRRDNLITQNGIKGLTDRQIRRIESGEQHATKSSLQLLAAAHGMDLQKYLSEIAKRVEELKQTN